MSLFCRAKTHSVSVLHLHADSDSGGLYGCGHGHGHLSRPISGGGGQHLHDHQLHLHDGKYILQNKCFKKACSFFFNWMCVQIFSGLLVNLKSIMDWLSWLKYLSIPRYGLEVWAFTLYIWATETLAVEVIFLWWLV